jgi:hypothetical protein
MDARLMLESSTVQVTFPPMLAGTLSVPLICSCCAALITPLPRTFVDVILTTGASEGRIATVICTDEDRTCA